MVAIANDPLKQQFVDLLFSEANDGNDSNQYYIGIGKADAYDSSDTVSTPIRTIQEEREARANLQSIKRVTGVSFVIPRYNWTSGTIYSAWSDNVVGLPANPYYVLTEDNEVYVCAKRGLDALGNENPSTIKPSYSNAGVDQTAAFQTSDGYIWKLVYSLSAARASTFLSSGYIPIEDIAIDSGGANTFELQQLNIQNTATPGQILGFEVISGGAGYTTAPTITINGNGTGAAATATISGGVIVKAEMTNFGSGYDFASAKLSSGSAVLRPIIGPRDGVGKSAISDLKSSSVMFNIKSDGAEGGNFNITNDFRQIALLKNPRLTDSAGGEGPIYTLNSAKVGRFMTLTGTVAASGFVVDEVITGGTSGVTAFVDELDSALGNIIYYHQNSNSVIGEFTDGENITGNGVGSATIDSGNKYTAVDMFSGDLLYLENRAKITRSAAQTEDIKVIITV